MLEAVKLRRGKYSENEGAGQTSLALIDLFPHLMLSLSAMTSSASSTDDLLKQGIAAARSGRKAEARDKLMLVVELDEQNEQAWLWLSGVVESDSDRRVCLENVLALNPASTAAQKGLRWLDEHAPASRRERCPHCQAELPATGNVCPACHQPVLISCPQCHEYVEIALRRCPQCGTTLGDYHNHNPYYLNLAEAYADRNNFPLANWALEQVTTAQPEADELLRCGALYLRLDRAARAVDMYRQAIERDPRQAAAYLQLGALYRQLELPDEMREVYQSGLAASAGRTRLAVGVGPGPERNRRSGSRSDRCAATRVKHQPGSDRGASVARAVVQSPGRFDVGAGALSAGVGQRRTGRGQCDRSAPRHRRFAALPLSMAGENSRATCWASCCALSVLR